MTFSVNDKPTSYSYSCTEKLAANYKVNISGTYSSDGVEMKGQIIGETWEGTTNVVFDFDGSGSTEAVEPGGDEEPGGEVTGDAPVAGTIYKGCYVLRVEGNVATLMTLKKIDYLSFDDTSLETVISENIASLVEGLEVVGGWRLPNREEIDYVYTHKTEINDNFHLIKDVPLDNFAATETFFYRENDNTIQVFPLTNGEPYEPTSGKATNLRAFTTKTF